MSSQPSTRRLATSFIFVNVVLDVMAGTIAFPVLPTLISALSRGDAARTAEWFGALGSAFFVMQFVAGPIQGALSDRFGRRPIILASAFGMAADFVIMALAPNLGWLFVGRVLSGAFAGSITAANAYIADGTPGEHRARMFGLMFAAMAFGQAIGPALGGYLAIWGVRVPFWVAAGVSILSALYGLFVLPELLPRELRAPFAWRDVNPVAAVFALIRAHPELLAWSGVVFLLSFGGLGLNNVFVVYTGYRYGWIPRDIGLFLSVIGIVSIGIQAGLVAVLVKWFGDRAVMLAGMALNAAGAVLGALSPTGRMFWLATLVLILGNISGPTQNAIMSRLVGPSEQGLLSGALNSIRSFNGIVSPLLFTMMFAFVVRAGGTLWSGVPLAVGGALIGLAGVIAARISHEARAGT